MSDVPFQSVPEKLSALRFRFARRHRDGRQRGWQQRDWHDHWIAFSLRFVGFVLSRRYRVSIVDGDSIRGRSGPILVLPNHPAYVDPALILTSLPVPRPLRPMVYVDTYRHPLLNVWLRWLRAIEVPDLRRERRTGGPKCRRAITEVINGLSGGESFLLYPSGRLQRDQREIIGSARAAYDVLQSSPGVTVVLVRTRGVWGSLFSCAPTGNVPNLSMSLWRGLFWWLAGFGAFLPRRDVTLTCQAIDSSELRGMDRGELNGWLESWYNRDGGEAPQFIPYHRLFARRRQPLGRVVEAACRMPRADSSPVIGWRRRAASAGQRWRSMARRQVNRMRLRKKIR